MAVNFVGINFLQIALSFLTMIIYEVLYTWCLRYNICSAWFLDIRTSTCFAKMFIHSLLLNIVGAKVSCYTVVMHNCFKELLEFGDVEVP